ncbi:calcium/sodium antiporter [Haloferula chungangensis]|uniref:Calcium/sodium antiporter n=1 Tax=Haloferula chungangensis TaxID=1048331 RepID=A0ABW2L3U7_9BACT
MEMLVHLAWLIGGLVLLSFGADWLVRGASELALKSGLKPLVIGLTVVAFGTSAPELIVSLKANLDPNTKADIAIGNVVGSNICNIALMLGLAALMRPFVVGSQVVRRELPILLVVTGAFIAMIWNGQLSRLEGSLMVVAIVAYVVTSIRISRQHRGDPAEHDIPEEALAAAADHSLKGLLKSVGWVLLGLAALLFGADKLVTSGVVLAKQMGVPELVIGLTLVALGTSLPELATTIAAVKRGQMDLVAGNIIGSNLFNILAVMGITAAAKPIEVEAMNPVNPVNLWVMGGVTLILVPFLAWGQKINRIEGGILVVGYLIYCTWLVVPQWFVF